VVGKQLDLLPSSLDSYKHNRNRPCGKKAATGRVERDGKELIGYSRLYCKSWRCSYCGPKKAAKIRKRISEKAKEHGLSRFLTLTLDPATAPKAGDVAYIREVWRKFRVYLKRKFKRNVSFISVVELHKSGYPHLHVLVDQYIPQHWISEAWSSLGGGRIVYIERINDLSKIGWYLGKYLTKEMLLSPDAPRRRYSSSRNVKLGNPEKSGWKPAKFTMETLHRVAKGRIVHESIDENSHVKSFVVEEEIVDVRPTEYLEEHK
jgi:hypothetical protein